MTNAASEKIVTIRSDASALLIHLRYVFSRALKTCAAQAAMEQLESSQDCTAVVTCEILVSVLPKAFDEMRQEMTIQECKRTNADGNQTQAA